MEKFDKRKNPRAMRCRAFSECSCLPNLNQIICLCGVDKDYIIWSICKQFLNYLTLTYKAVRMLGSMCSAQWFHNCYLCGDFILSETVYLLLYCTKLNLFRDALLQKLLFYT